MDLNQETILSALDFYLIMSSNFSYPRCIEIFGEEMGKHLWKKWESSGENIIYFMSSLDGDNKNILIEWHLKKYPIYY